MGDTPAENAGRRFSPPIKEIYLKFLWGIPLCKINSGISLSRKI